MTLTRDLSLGLLSLHVYFAEDPVNQAFLSQGAIIGIALAALVFVAIIIIVIVVVTPNKKKRKHGTFDLEPSSVSHWKQLIHLI